MIVGDPAAQQRRDRDTYPAIQRRQELFARQPKPARTLLVEGGANADAVGERLAAGVQYRAENGETNAERGIKANGVQLPARR